MSTFDWGLGRYERTAAALEPAANEQPDAFRVTSRYVVATARRA